ncbi:MAG: lipid A biosynthesis acyltransferase [Steroidobacteraceae bacterium]
MNAYWEQQRERSNVVALRLLILASQFFGRFMIRIVLWPIVIYFLLTAPAARRASRQALRRLLQREPSLGDIAKNFYHFAMCNVDRLYLLNDKQHHLHIDVSRPEAVAQLAARGTGCILLMAHLGSFEPLRTLGTTQQKLPLSILMDRAQGQMLVKILERINPHFALQIIDAAQRGPVLMLQLKEALQAGRMVCIMADRARADERVLNVEFCDGHARLPEGPWALASALGVPVILGFGLYRGGRHYSAHFELFSERIQSNREQRSANLHACAQRYAQRLEHYARLAPYNWFNFYGYWADSATQQLDRQYSHPPTANP